MMRLARDFRLIPIVLLATICLFALKVSGLVFRRRLYAGRAAAGPQQDRHAGHHRRIRARLSQYRRGGKAAIPWAPPRQGRGPGRRRCSTSTTPSRRHGSISGDGKSKTEPLKVSEKAPAAPKLEIAGNSYVLELGKVSSPGERAVLERLQDRRQELDTRSRDIEMRENCSGAEKRWKPSFAELKEVEARPSTPPWARATRPRRSASRASFRVRKT